MSTIVRRVVSTLKAPGAVGPYRMSGGNGLFHAIFDKTWPKSTFVLFIIYSQAVLVDKTLYVSGQLGLDAETMDFVSNDVQEQTKKALTNMGHILEAAGTSFDKVVKTTVLLADINDFTKVNDVYITYILGQVCYQASFFMGDITSLRIKVAEPGTSASDKTYLAKPARTF